MIKVTRFNNSVLLINAENIQSVEANPDTVITFINRDRLLVKEPVEEVTQRIVQYRRVLQAPGEGAEAWRTALASLEQQLRRDFGARPAVAAPPAATAAAADEQRLLARVREIVRESEDGLRSEFGVRLAGAVTEFDTRRRADLVRIEENFGQLEGRAGIEAARTNNMLQYLMRVSQSGGTVIK